MRRYDAVIVIDSRLEDAAITQSVDRITAAIEEVGEVVKADHWGRRKLAFEIDHLTEGYYFVADFKSEPERIQELGRILKLGEEYLRHKIVRVPDQGSAKPPGGGEDVKQHHSSGKPDERT